MDNILKFAEQQLQGQFQNQGQSQGNQGGYGQESGNYGQQQQQGGQGYGGQQQYGSNQGGEAQGYYNQNQGGQGQQGGEYGQTGGAQYNRPHGEGGSYQQQGGAPDVDHSAALEAANQHAGNGNENASMFSHALGQLGGMNASNAGDVDEQSVLNHHDQAYGQGNAGNLPANAMGSAAAMQALKMFTSGQSGASGSGGGNMQSKIIGMAMSEAAKLFDQSGGAASGNKQDAINSAGATIMQLMMKNQISGMIGGGNSGGLSSLMGMASKFM